MKDIYLKFTQKQNSKNIPGESLDEAHKDGKWMEISQWRHELRQPKSASSSTAGGHTAERCEHGEMLFSKDIDTSSPYIWEACSAGYAYDVEIQFFRAQGSVRTQYLNIKLFNAVISSVTPTVQSEGLPTETMVSSTPRSCGHIRVRRQTVQPTWATMWVVGISLRTRSPRPEQAIFQGRVMRPFFVASCGFKLLCGIGF
jgi:type VI secretion system secreted protein Hcp